MPFDTRVGNEVPYQAAKPTYIYAGMITFYVYKKLIFFIFIIEDYPTEEPEHLRPKLSKFFKIFLTNFSFIFNSL
jgi:hypothetical protein